MLPSFLITFREGLEAFLLVGILLTYLRKLDARQYARWIHLGVVAGVLVSLAVAVVFQLLVSQFDNERYQNYLMIGILLFATGVLTYMAIWMQKQAQAQTERVKAQLAALVTTGNLVGMVALAFIAVMREGVETILFFSALMYSGQGVTLESGLAGALLGLVASILLVWLLMRGARNVPLKAFFRYTSLLILVIAAGLLGSAVNMMQAAALIPAGGAPLFDIAHILDDRSTFGTFLRALFGYNSSPTPLQFGVWAIYLSVALVLWQRSYRAQPAARPAGSSHAV